MAIRQPRVPEYREREGAEKTLRALILFLKDFATAAWAANNRRIREIEAVRAQIAEMPEMPEIRYPVTKVNGKTGEVTLGAADVGALASGARAADSAKFDGRTWAQALLAHYPVGSVYMSTKSESPASLFGGTWEQIKDRFLIGAGGTYAAGATGGAATVTLTTSQIPAHSHIQQAQTDDGNTNPVVNAKQTGSAEGGKAQDVYIWATSKAFIRTRTLGGGQAHNNMPPYLSVYMWRRVA